MFILTCCRAQYQEARCVWMVFAISWYLHIYQGPISTCSRSTPAEKHEPLIPNTDHTSCSTRTGKQRKDCRYLKQPQVGRHYLFSLILKANSSQLLKGHNNQIKPINECPHLKSGCIEVEGRVGMWHEWCFKARGEAHAATEANIKLLAAG